MLQYLVIVGAAAEIFGVLAYIRATLRGTTKPNRVSWFMWSLGSFVAAAAAFADGVGWAAIPVFMSGVGPFLVFMASFANKNAYWKLGKFDYLCGLFSVLALALWAATREAAVAVLFAIISDIFACVPTIAKAWKHPETESGITHIATLFNGLTSFAAIKAWNFTSYAFPVYLSAASFLLVFSVYRRKMAKLAACCK
ncbi:MAG: hypothetical protein MUD10_00620 [Candidatus Pacebacteria bacterium]|jgi:hypothetical protein|nr:hypothetical protein [Candidatus Paceibacterota bacterium]